MGKVVHVSFSSSGGAGRVASQLVGSQANLGWDSQLISFTDTNLRAEPFALPLHSLFAGFDHVVHKSTRFEGLISLSRDRLARSLRDELSDADVVHLHWINGVTNIDHVRKVAPRAKIVWTLHDMNPFTGVCHQSFGCLRFRDDCSACPAVRSFSQRSVSLSLQEKASVYGRTSNLTVVAPSNWLRELAAESHAMRGLDIRVIPNPVGDLFARESVPSSRDSESLRPLFRPHFCLIATDLDDPLKNVKFAVEAFSVFRTKNPQARLVLAGRNGARFALHEGVELRGELDTGAIQKLLSQSCALLLPSLAENAPVVVAEAACLGTPTIASNIPPLAEITNSLGFGGLADTPGEMGRIMNQFWQALRTQSGLDDREDLRTKAHALFHPRQIADKYLKLYEGAE